MFSMQQLISFHSDVKVRIMKRVFLTNWKVEIIGVKRMIELIILISSIPFEIIFEKSSQSSLKNDDDPHGLDMSKKCNGCLSKSNRCCDFVS